MHEADPVDDLYFPVTHAVHVPPLDPVKPVLQVQLVKDGLPVGELEFNGQVMQVEVVEAPTAEEYVSSPQLVHTGAPVVVKYVPAPQSVHVEVDEDPTAVEYFPAPQSMHRADPVDDLYFPATHAVQVPPSGPFQPVLQVQFVKSVFPAGELEFDGQAMHVEANVLQEATKPVLCTLLSDVKTTCMYPVLDV